MTIVNYLFCVNMIVFIGLLCMKRIPASRQMLQLGCRVSNSVAPILLGIASRILP